MWVFELFVYPLKRHTKSKKAQNGERKNKTGDQSPRAEFVASVTSDLKPVSVDIFLHDRHCAIGASPENSDINRILQRKDPRIIWYLVWKGYMNIDWKLEKDPGGSHDFIVKASNAGKCTGEASGMREGDYSG